VCHGYNKKLTGQCVIKEFKVWSIAGMVYLLKIEIMSKLGTSL
jgi:hypothetical protein